MSARMRPCAHCSWRAMNHLYYGDNLEVLRASIPDESVDLVYLDPPFNSNRNYNVLFGRHTVEAASDAAQIQAFGISPRNLSGDLSSGSRVS